MSFFCWFPWARGAAAAPSGKVVEVAGRSHSGVGAGFCRPGALLWKVAASLLVVLLAGQGRTVHAQGNCLPTGAQIVGCELVPGPEIPLRPRECVRFQMIATLADGSRIDVTNCASFQPLDDPAHCLVQAGPSEFCLPASTPAPCIGQRIVVRGSFQEGDQSCVAETGIDLTSPQASQAVSFFANPGFRLFPADCLLRTVTILPVDLNGSVASATVQLVSIASNSGGSGIQPESVILKDTSTPASPGIIVQLRACLNPGGQRRVYTLIFKVTQPNGAVSFASIQIDVPSCCMPRGVP